MPRPVAGPASNSAVRLSALTTVLMHVVPIGIIQVADYVSDIFVVLDFYEQAQADRCAEGGDALWCSLWWVGLAFIGASVAGAYLLCMLVPCQALNITPTDLPYRHLGWVALLAPFNMHVLYLGVAQGKAKAAAEELKHEARSAVRLWREHEAALEGFDDVARRGAADEVRSAFKRLQDAEKALKQDSRTKNYVIKSDEAEELNFLFVATKALETALESLPLSVLTSASLFAGHTEHPALLWSSLALSVMSMAYGYFGGCIAGQTKLVGDEKTLDPTHGKQPKMFLAILAQVTFSVGAMGLCYSSARWIDWIAYVLPWTALAVIFVCCCPVFAVLAAIFAVSEARKKEGGLGRKFGEFCFTIFFIGFICTILISGISAQTAAVDLFLMVGFSFGGDASRFLMIPLVFFRRGLLYLMIFWPLSEMNTSSNATITDITAIEPGFTHNELLTFALIGGALDLVATFYLLYTLKYWCCCRKGRRIGRAQPSQPDPPPAADQARTVEIDLLEAVQRHAQRAVDGTTGHLRSALEALQPCADALLVRAREDALNSEEKTAVHGAIHVYKPSETGDTEWTLCNSLNDVNRRSLQPASATSARQSYQHPMRATRLVFGLMASIWTTVPSFFGPKVEGSNFELSHDADRCTYFVSHSWRDNGRKKLMMLREFLCLQAVLGRALVVLPLTACFFLPLGFALDSAIKMPFWILSALPLSLLAILLFWVQLSIIGCMPANAMPWAFSTKTLWIDKLCIDQSTPETTAAGVAGFSRFLSNCDRMVALISTSYFSRLWCVYELAVFTRDNGMHLPGAAHGKLLLLSLDWPSSLNPFKRARLSEHEKKLITNFSCRDADCFLPRDRATVLAAIREKFGSEAAFDQFVRTHLPAVLERSKREYSSNLLNVAAEALERSFGV